jgi:hypothetical protein
LEQFSPILILLSKHFKRFGGVQKFLLGKLSYMFVYGSIDHSTMKMFAMNIGLKPKKPTIPLAKMMANIASI